MKVLFLIIALLIAIICMLLFAETKAEIKYKDKKLDIILRTGFLRLKLSPKTDKKKLKAEKKEEQEEASEAERTIGSIKEKYKEYKEIIHVFLKAMRYRVKINKLEIGLEYGTGNAATTGMLYGVIWGLITGAYNLLTVFFNMEFPKAEISPDFQKSKFDFTFNGILRVRLVHIINALIKIYFSGKNLK